MVHDLEQDFVLALKVVIEAALLSLSAAAMSFIDVASYPRCWNSRAAVRRISCRESTTVLACHRVPW